jgi:hypothetical protein
MVELKPPVERSEPVVEADNVELAEVMRLDPESEPAGSMLAADDEAARAALGGLADDAVGRRFYRSREASLGHGADAHPDRALFGERTHGDAESAVGEDGRKDPVRELTQLGGGPCEFRISEIELSGRFGVTTVPELRAHEAERETECDQSLLRAVVEVAFEPSTFGVAGGHDAGLGGSKLLEPRAGLRLQTLVLERKAGGRSHRVDELLVAEQPGRMPEHGNRAAVAEERRLLLVACEIYRSAFCVDQAADAVDGVGEHEVRIADDPA